MGSHEWNLIAILTTRTRNTWVAVETLRDRSHLTTTILSEILSQSHSYNKQFAFSLKIILLSQTSPTPIHDDKIY